MSCALRSLRDRIEKLATRDGRYGVACARTGVTPVPVAGLWFESREAARRAARLASAYRARLRRFDSGVERHDLVVHECPIAPVRPDRDAGAPRDASDTEWPSIDD